MTMQGNLADRLNELKKHYGHENYTELIRFLINHAYEQIEQRRT